jgi:predicted phosphodiesterase
MKIVVLGDIHFPFQNKKALQRVIDDIRRQKPTHVVQIGDLYDPYAFSRFSKKNIQLPQEEWKQARQQAVQMWNEIRAAAPKASAPRSSRSS